MRVAPWGVRRGSTFAIFCGYEKNIFNYHKKTIFPVDTSQGVTPKTHNTKLFPPPPPTQHSKLKMTSVEELRALIELSDAALDAKISQVDAIVIRIRQENRMANNDERAEFESLEEEIDDLTSYHEGLLELMNALISVISERAETARVQSLVYLNA